MPKSRTSAPSREKDGNWFQHIGYSDYKADPQRFQCTSTGIMISSTFSPESRFKPAPPPETYYRKYNRNFKEANEFSFHDNRNSLQHTGEYLGDGRDTRTLGKRNNEPKDRQHHTETTYLKHQSLEPTNYDYNTTSGRTYTGLPTIEPPRFRRFRQTYSEGEQGPVGPSTNTTQWHEMGNPEFKTQTQVLASSQEPFLKPNSWRYSYHGLSRVYPPYGEIKERPLPKIIVN